MKLRLRFSKTGKVRWTSHRDVARMWERAFRRTRLPLVYTAGFSPRPKISFGLALPTGHESVAEYLDVELAHEGPQSVAEDNGDAAPRERRSGGRIEHDALVRQLRDADPRVRAAAFEKLKIARR